mmetsp:Transcript_77695/g.251646  ORF Transcript_77695/g.251646 Transcript_77695/m.251646 type:complete len:360 (+) Transcript_77695:254-1333(+)
MAIPCGPRPGRCAPLRGEAGDCRGWVLRLQGSIPGRGGAEEPPRVGGQGSCLVLQCQGLVWTWPWPRHAAQLWWEPVLGARPKQVPEHPGHLPLGHHLDVLLRPLEQKALDGPPEPSDEDAWEEDVHFRSSLGVTHRCQALHGLDEGQKEVLHARAGRVDPHYVLVQRVVLQRVAPGPTRQQMADHSIQGGAEALLEEVRVPGRQEAGADDDHRPPISVLKGEEDGCRIEPTVRRGHHTWETLPPRHVILQVGRGPRLVVFRRQQEASHHVVVNGLVELRLPGFVAPASEAAAAAAAAPAAGLGLPNGRRPRFHAPPAALVLPEGRMNRLHPVLQATRLCFGQAQQLRKAAKLRVCDPP